MKIPKELQVVSKSVSTLSEKGSSGAQESELLHRQKKSTVKKQVEVLLFIVPYRNSII